MSTDEKYPRCAHCGGNGAHWIAWRGRCAAVKDLRREQAGDELLCTFCRRRFAAGDWIEPGCAKWHPEALREARRQREAMEA